MGTPEWIKSEGIEWNEMIEQNLKLSKSKSQSVVGVSLENKCKGNIRNASTNLYIYFPNSCANWYIAPPSDVSEIRFDIYDKEY